MTDLDIAGIGIWSPFFSDWQAFCNGINNGNWQTNTPLKPSLIPAKELRRAPQSVKMAMEVLGQACAMLPEDSRKAAVVFSSAMGDIQITDYLCRILAETPRLVSPTRFHNSVHNAATGYWSIASHTHAPTNAVSALSYSATMAFLEAAVQAAEEELPVLLVSQEMAAPAALHFACPSDYPISVAMLLTKPGVCVNPMASVQFNICRKEVGWPELPGELSGFFEGNFGARLIPLLAAIATGRFAAPKTPISFGFPLSKSTGLGITLKTLVSAEKKHD
ncbi:MAG: beta-ketoacyl synthase chain length factor [Lysobacterales bacterium]